MATPENTNMSNMSYAFKQMIDRDKLTGENFNDWHRSLRITLRMARRYDYLGEPSQVYIFSTFFVMLV